VISITIVRSWCSVVFVSLACPSIRSAVVYVSSSTLFERVLATTSPSQLEFPPQNLSEFRKNFFRVETHEKNAFEEIVSFPTYSTFSTQSKKPLLGLQVGHKNPTMPKQNKCSQRAREREAAKRGEITPAIRTYAKEIRADPTYEDDFDDSASEIFEAGLVIASTSNTIPDNDPMDLDWTANNVGQLLNSLVVN
jgi:hypothetical protein